MAIAELVMPGVVDLAPKCWFCRKIVGAEQFCFGCRKFVCDDCDWTSPTGDHDVMRHQELEGEDD